MSSEVQIYLDDYNHFCTPGQTINGRVICNFNSEKQIQAILVRFTGKCNTSWTETEKYYDDFFKEDRTRDVDYYGEEIYFDREVNLTEDQGTFTVSPGRHDYNFSYQLPEHLPSTYEGPNGWASVQYRIKAAVDSPWKFNVEAVAILNVISPLDLNYVPRIREPVEISVDKVLCSCWCTSGDALTFTFSLPSTGCVPGQDVRIGACVENLTNATVQDVIFKITELTEFIAETPSTCIKHNKEVIVDNANGRIGAHGEKSWTAVLTIPHNRYFPNLVPCNLIKVSHVLKAEVVLPCPHSNLKASIPITIGHVQFVGVDVNTVLGPPPDTVNASAPSSDRALLVPNSDRRNYGSIYPTAPPNNEQGMPPSYEEVQKSQAQ